MSFFTKTIDKLFRLWYNICIVEMRPWRNRQTRWFQVPVGVTRWRFKSSRAHQRQSRIFIFRDCFFLFLFVLSFRSFSFLLVSHFLPVLHFYVSSCLPFRSLPARRQMTSYGICSGEVPSSSGRSYASKKRSVISPFSYTSR